MHRGQYAAHNVYCQNVQRGCCDDAKVHAVGLMSVIYIAYSYGITEL